MTTFTTIAETADLARHEGLMVLSAAEALIKGAMESELAVDVIAGPRDSAFDAVFDAAESESIAGLLRRHGTTLLATGESSRAIALALRAAESGRRALALVPNVQLDRSMPMIQAACDGLSSGPWLGAVAASGAGTIPATGAAASPGGALGLVLEDDPRACPASDPRRAADRAGLACIECCSVPDLRDSIERLLRLSRAGGCPVALVVHSAVLRSIDTMEAKPNRVIESVEAILAQRRRPGKRVSESGGLLRAARRLELNAFRKVPNPGERVPVGFVTVGPAEGALAHVVAVLGLAGRVPVLRLGLIHPIDESVLGRMLLRCDQVVVLEPRPGGMEAGVLAVAESLRRKGERPAGVWGRLLPPDPAGQSATMEPEDTLHPSILARKIIHLLHALRPTLQVASQLVPDPPRLPVEPAPRGAEVGPAAALAFVRSALVELDQRLGRREATETNGEERIALAIDGIQPTATEARVVQTESWEHSRFLIEGIAALRQAARDTRPWLFIVCDLGSEDPQDLERIIRGSIPGDRTDRVRVVTVNLAERPALDEALRDAAQSNQMTVVLARDGPPARYSPARLQRTLGEIDRLGFQPRQRVTWPLARQSPIHQNPGEMAAYGRAPRPDDRPLTSHAAVERLERRDAPWRIHIEPLLEQVEVIRTRPPPARLLGAVPARLPVPAPLHAQHSQWRAHVAGFRGSGPGLAAKALCDAGRAMGYHVRAAHDPTPVGPGRGAWAQVLFTRPRSEGAAMALEAAIPYGEADLLLGLDVQETLRAIGPDVRLRVSAPERTFAIANRSAFGDETDQELADACATMLEPSIAAVTRTEPRLIADFAGVIRGAFHTDRVADLALLGAAYQCGLVPVSLEAIESAVARLESEGFGRSAEVFRFGRHLAADVHLFVRPALPQEETVQQLIRRTVRSIGRERWGGTARASRFGYLLRITLEQMPGLTVAATNPDAAAERPDEKFETPACREFVAAMARCQIWGGFEYARRYATTLQRLYDADRPESGHVLTRSAILPLAEGMLLRDPVYMAQLATSFDQRRRTRQQLDIKRGRGDRLSRHFLTRFEITAAGRCARLDARTSDWPAAIIAVLGRAVPHRWRGSIATRALREDVVRFIEEAATMSPQNHDRWFTAMRRLQEAAADDAFDSAALAEARGILQLPLAAPSPA